MTASTLGSLHLKNRPVAFEKKHCRWNHLCLWCFWNFLRCINENICFSPNRFSFYLPSYDRTGAGILFLGAKLILCKRTKHSLSDGSAIIKNSTSLLANCSCYITFSAKLKGLLDAFLKLFNVTIWLRFVAGILHRSVALWFVSKAKLRDTSLFNNLRMDPSFWATPIHCATHQLLFPWKSLWRTLAGSLQNSCDTLSLAGYELSATVQNLSWLDSYVLS